MASFSQPIFLQGPMKLGRLIVLQVTQLQLKNIYYLSNSLFAIPTYLISIFLNFSVRKNKTRARRLPYLFICLPDHLCKASSWQMGGSLT